MKVYVVMGNDYPDAVYSTEAAAESHCAARRLEPASMSKFGPRIYWRVYEFHLNGEGTP